MCHVVRSSLIGKVDSRVPCVAIGASSTAPSEFMKDVLVT